MKNVLAILTGWLIVTGCSFNSDRNKQSVNSVANPDSLIENKESVYTPPDSCKIETPLFFNDPLRNLKDFTINVNNPPFDKIINELINSVNDQETTKSDYCLSDCCGSLKILSDNISNTKVYLFKTDCAYSFSNDQYLFVNDTLSIIRQYKCGVYDFRTDSTSPSIKMEEKLFIFNPDNVITKERKKTIRGDKNYTLSDIAFKDTIGDRTELLKNKTEEFTNRIDLIRNIEEEKALNAEAERLRIEKQNEIINNITREQLSSIGESRRKTFEKLLTNRAMKEKRYYFLAGSKNSITAYYQYKRIVMIIYKTINSSNEVTATNAFYFDESNNCIYNTNWNIKDKISYTYDMHWGSLIKYDVNYQRMNIDPDEKQQIIQSARASLASMMEHFPDFRYTFYWK